MGALDLLLSKDTKRLFERPEKTIEVARLSEVYGEPFVARVRAMTMGEFDALPKDGDIRTNVVLAGMVEPDLKNAALLEKLKPEGRNGPLLPTEAAARLFLPGEITAIYKVISDLSGFGVDAVRELKKK